MTASVTATATPVTELDVDVIVSGSVAGDDGPEPAGGAEALDAALGGRLRQILADLGATGRAADAVRFATLGATRAPAVLAVGLGERSDSYDPEVLRRAAGAATRTLAGAGRVAVTLAYAGGPAGEAELRAVAEGAALGAYAYSGRPDSNGARPPVREVLLTGDAVDEPAAAAAGHRAQVIARSVTLTRDLVNTPPGDLPPARLAEIAAKEASEVGVEAVVLTEDGLAELGFGGILGVGAGSENPPRLVRLDWRPAGAERTIALVGKGITFDSGGLSLKPPTAMEWMKSDMAGAAAVLGAILAAARLDLPVAVTGWLPIAENMPSGTAIRPSDVLTLYGGTRVEVLNTDAEGRIVLADAIARAAEDEPDLIVDIATLTGAQLVALGTRTGGVLGRDGARERVVAAAEAAGESMWPMPMPAELRKGLDSSVADLANVAANGGRDGAMSVGALFLESFVPDGLDWAHLDIAGPAWNGGEPYGYTPKGGTGFAVRTLLRVVEDW